MLQPGFMPSEGRHSLFRKEQRMKVDSWWDRQVEVATVFMMLPLPERHHANNKEYLLSDKSQDTARVIGHCLAKWVANVTIHIDFS